MALFCYIVAAFYYLAGGVMAIFAYCRVSTIEQSSMLQEEAILKAYPDAVVHHEQKSVTSKAGRDVLHAVLQALQPGDKLVVWKLDRLARNMSDLLAIVDYVEGQGASLEILDQRIDTSTAAGRAFLQMLGVFAEFETNIRRERQAAGIAKARRERPEAYSGRKPSIDAQKVRELLMAGLKADEVAKSLGISRSSVYLYRRRFQGL